MPSARGGACPHRRVTSRGGCAPVRAAAARLSRRRATRSAPLRRPEQLAIGVRGPLCAVVRHCPRCIARSRKRRCGEEQRGDDARADAHRGRRERASVLGRLSNETVGVHVDEEGRKVQFARGRDDRAVVVALDLDVEGRVRFRRTGLTRRRRFARRLEGGHGTPDRLLRIGGRAGRLFQTLRQPTGTNLANHLSDSRRDMDTVDADALRAPSRARHRVAADPVCQLSLQRARDAARGFTMGHDARFPGLFFPLPLSAL